MEQNKKIDLSLNLDNLIKEIKALESEYLNVQLKIKLVQNEMVTEEHVKKLAEVKIDKLNVDEKFYVENTKKIVNRLYKAEAIRSQFSNALEYYENLIQNYELNFFNKEQEIDIDEMIGEGNSSYIQKAMKQIEECEKDIEKHNSKIQALFNNLQFDVLN